MTTERKPEDFKPSDWELSQAYQQIQAKRRAGRQQRPRRFEAGTPQPDESAGAADVVAWLIVGVVVASLFVELAKIIL